MIKKCKVKGCNNVLYARGYCKSKHYCQFLRHGKILKNTKYDKNKIIVKKYKAEIILKNKDFIEVGRVIIDLEDIEEMNKHKWCLDSDGYAVSTKGKTTKMHRIIMGAKKEQITDHINRNRLDNRKSNLRFVTASQNVHNSKISKFNTTGKKGVSWCKRDKLYCAQLCVNNKNMRLGSTKDYNEAVRWREQAEKKYEVNQ